MSDEHSYSHLSLEELQSLRRSFDSAIENLGSSAPAPAPESEPLDENGLNASERKACSAHGCDPKTFLRLKATFGGSRGR